MKSRIWSLWTAMAAVIALTAMFLCVSPSRADFSALAALPAVSVRPAVPVEGKLVDINTAGTEELMTLPDIGAVRAAAIIEYRTVNGPFRYPEELIYVPGIGEGTLEGLLDLITAGGG